MIRFIGRKTAAKYVRYWTESLSLIAFRAISLANSPLRNSISLMICTRLAEKKRNAHNVQDTLKLAFQKLGVNFNLTHDFCEIPHLRLELCMAHSLREFFNNHYSPTELIHGLFSLSDSKAV